MGEGRCPSLDWVSSRHLSGSKTPGNAGTVTYGQFQEGVIKGVFICKCGGWHGQNPGLEMRGCHHPGIGREERKESSRDPGERM